jgi:hypothetical protein
MGKQLTLHRFGWPTEDDGAQYVVSVAIISSWPSRHGRATNLVITSSIACKFENLSGKILKNRREVD